MPDFSRLACHQFWKNYKDPAIYRVICFMESVESWTIDEKEDNPLLDSTLQNLGETLDTAAGVDFSQLNQDRALIKVGAYLKASRCLYLLQTLDMNQPGAASRLLIYAETLSKEEPVIAGLFLRRNVIFERLRLLSRIFSPERLSLVMKVLESEDHL